MSDNNGNDVLFAWLGPADVKGPDKGPVIEAIDALKPSHIVLIYAEGSYKKALSYREYKSELEHKLEQNYESKIECDIEQVVVNDASFSDAYKQSHKVLTNYKNYSNKNAFITSGMMQQGLIWVLLAKEFHLKLLACPKGKPIQQILVPLNPEKFDSSEMLFRDHCQVFAWLAKPTENSESHHNNGAVAAWIAHHGDKTKQLNLMIEVSKVNKEAFTESLKSPDPSLLCNNKGEKDKYDQDKLDLYKKISSDSLKDKIAFQISAVDFNDLTSIFYEALAFVEKQLEGNQNDDVIFLVNSGSKENNLAWIMLKVLYPQARLYAAWKDSYELLDPKRLLYPHKIDCMLSDTKGWFAATSNEGLPHIFDNISDVHWQQVVNLWPFLEQFKDDKDEYLFNILKFLCGKYSYFGSGKYGPTLGGVLIILGMAVNNKDNFTPLLNNLKVDDNFKCLSKQCPDIVATEAYQNEKKETYRNLLVSFYNLFENIVWDKANPEISTIESLELDKNKPRLLKIRLNFKIEACLTKNLTEETGGDARDTYKSLQNELNKWQNLSVRLEDKSIIIQHGE